LWERIGDIGSKRGGDKTGGGGWSSEML